MKITPPAPARSPTAREFHARRCFLLGITEPAKVARLWSEEKVLVAAALASVDGARPKRRRRGRAEP